MKTSHFSFSLGIAVGLATVTALAATGSAGPRRYVDIVTDVANMVDDDNAYELAERYGLDIVNVMWEDTGRYEGSSVGPNISDVTIEVEVEVDDKRRQSFLMPVLRHPNFSDKTADIKIDEFFVNVGNQAEGGKLEPISLKEFLAHPSKYMSMPGKGKIKGGSLLSERDKHVLVSAQHAFLPIRQGGKATFRPVIFNYQSWEKNPAVLTLLVTRQGTSLTVVDNNRDTVTGGDSWGQRLFFNKAGQRTPLIAERLADVKASGVTANGEAAASLGKDSNLLMIIQVPLKVKANLEMAWDGDGVEFDEGEMPMGGAKSAPTKSASAASGDTRGRSDIDVAVLGHGKIEGPFTELDGLTIERDPRFPVRVTVQFYQATSNGVVSKQNFKDMAAQLRKVYGKGEYVGSLVLPDGQTRPTGWNATKEPIGLGWRAFPGLLERQQKYGVGGLTWYRNILHP